MPFVPDKCVGLDSEPLFLSLPPCGQELCLGLCFVKQLPAGWLSSPWRPRRDATGTGSPVPLSELRDLRCPPARPWGRGPEAQPLDANPAARLCYGNKSLQMLRPAPCIKWVWMNPGLLA